MLQLVSSRVPYGSTCFHQISYRSTRIHLVPWDLPWFPVPPTLLMWYRRSHNRWSTLAFPPHHLSHCQGTVGRGKRRSQTNSWDPEAEMRSERGIEASVVLMDTGRSASHYRTQVMFRELRFKWSGRDTGEEKVNCSVFFCAETLPKWSQTQALLTTPCL